jgi:hypothetical protein
VQRSAARKGDSTSTQSGINLQNRRRNIMKNLKKLFVAISLTIVLAGTALAECPPPVPGEMNSPPCNATQELTENSTNQATPTTITTELEIFTLDTVIHGLESLLTVY